MPKTFTILVIIFVSVLILLGLVRQIGEALNASSRLDRAADEVSSLQEENQGLRKKLSSVQQLDYIEEIARDKLNYALPGETVVIIPNEAIERVLGLDKKIEEVKLPNWQGWLKLFFK